MRSLNRRTILFCATSSSSSSSPHSISTLFSQLGNIDEPHKKKRGFHHFSSSSSSSSSSSWRHYDEESRNVRVSVWWDFENCTVPSGINVFRVAQRITSAVRSSGIKGPVTITAFGDVTQLSRSNQEALSSTGICLNHIPRGGKNSADRSLLLDLVYWVSQNPPPAHLFLISGDRDFANILHRLRMNNFNILLASPESAPGVLCSAASIVWQWNSLVRGDSHTGKHFNQPPDGPYGSWYGHYKGPLEDPFLDVEQPGILKPENSVRPENSVEPSIDSKPRPVPKALINRICQIVNSYPNGVSISDLRIELGKTNVLMDKDYFGHKKFSRLLLSLTAVLKIRSANDGQILVHSILPKDASSVESNSKILPVLETKKDEGDQNATAASNGEKSTVVPEVFEKSSVQPVAPQKAKESPPVPAKEINEITILSGSSSGKEHDSISEVGVLRKVWRSWFGHKQSLSNSNSSNGSFESSNTVDGSEKTRSKEKLAESMSHHTDPLASSSSSSSTVNKAVQEESIAPNSGKSDTKSRLKTGFFDHIVTWCRSILTGTGATDERGKRCNEVKQILIQPENREALSRKSFLDEMESFICSDKGSAVISQSMTREEIAEKLRKEGPSVLGTVNTADLLHFIDSLISEKRWVEECFSRDNPFKIIHPARRCSPPNPPNSNGLSSMFSGTTFQSKDLEKEKGQNLCKIGAVSAKSSVSASGKSKSEILTDCQKLVSEILEEHPEGFNMGRFRKSFIERYGYSLNCQALGYQKLALLLQTIPGLKIESNYIIPSANLTPEILPNDGNGKFNKLFDSARNDDDREYAWDELGPLSEPILNGNDTKPSFNRKTHHEKESRVDCDDGYLLPEEFTDGDSEGEAATIAGAEREEKSKRYEEDSSLLQILDSWHSSKNGKASKNGLQDVDELVDCSRKGSTSTFSGNGSDTIPSVTSSGRKTLPRKNYSFVADTGVDEKEKLIDSILVSMKKSSDSKSAELKV